MECIHILASILLMQRATNVLLCHPTTIQKSAIECEMLLIIVATPSPWLLNNWKLHIKKCAPRPRNGGDGKRWGGTGCVCYNVRPCRERAIRRKTRGNMINFVIKICPYLSRCQPVKGNRIAADFGNKDSSNKNEKPSLSCNFNKATK